MEDYVEENRNTQTNPKNNDEIIIEDTKAWKKCKAERRAYIMETQKYPKASISILL